ncbi:MAG TPA: YccF domain-containing protein, partial [Anseongella sp.]|nr:YccF domain-containing protein [Anseongella sp.]
MSIIGNLIWLVFGGIIICLEYLVAGVLMLLTIIGIPWGIQCFKMAGLALWPFGREVREARQVTGCLNTLLNIVWI